MKRHLMTQTNLSSESGRSMVEMLGVLAIVGVLSIGGIMGYRAALHRYRANEIFGEINKRMIVAKTQYLSGERVNLSEFPDTIEGSPFSFWCVNAAPYCGYGCSISIFNIPSELCGALKSLAANNTQYDIYTDCGQSMMMEDVDCDTWADPICGGMMVLYSYD